MFRVAGPLYLVSAIVLGALFLGAALAPTKPNENRWARRLFIVSLVYLTLLFAVLSVDALLQS